MDGPQRARPLTVDEAGLLHTPEGPRIVLAVGALNFTALDHEAQDAKAALWNDMAARLAPGQGVQVVVRSMPASPRDLHAEIVRQFDPSPGPLREFGEAWARRWRDAVAGQHVPRRRAHLIIAPAPRVPGERSADRVRLERAARSIMDHVARLGAGVTRLDRPRVEELLRGVLAPAPGGGWRIPPLIAEGREHVRLGVARAPYRATLYALDWPAETDPGWLAPLLAFDAPFTLSVHLRGLDPKRERRRLRTRRQFLADVVTTTHSARLDVAVAEATAESGTQATRLGSTQAIVKLGVYVTVEAESPEALADVRQRLQDRLDRQMDVRVAPGLAHQDPLYLSSLPLGMDVARSTYRCDSRTVGNMIPLLRESPGTEGGYPLAFTPGGELVQLDLASPALRNRLMSVVGQAGRGKSVLAQKLVTWFLLRGGWATVVDKTPTGYRALAALAGGEIVSLGAGPDTTSVNMWEGDVSTDATLASKVEFILFAHTTLLLASGEKPSGWESTMLEDGIRAVLQGYRTPGDEGRALPLERDLATWLADQERNAEWTEEERRSLRGLRFRLRPYTYDWLYGPLVDRPTSVDLGRRFLVFDLRRISEQSAIKAFVMFSLTEIATRRAALARAESRAAGRGSDDHIYWVDEGWWMLKYGSAEAADTLARTGRHGAQTAGYATQKLSDIMTPAAEAFFDQASLHVLFGLRDTGGTVRGGLSPRAWLADALRLTPHEVAQIDNLAGVKNSYAQMFLIRGDRDAPIPAHGVCNVPLTPEERWLYASDPDDVVEVERAIAAHGRDVWAAIQSLARGDQREGAA